MREIKFRVYDKGYKKTHIVGTDSHDELTCFNGVVQYYNLQNGEGSGKYGDYILMQYTGLKDRNGQEIYEGDIISFEDAYYSTSENGQEFEVFQNKGAIEYCSEELRYYVTNKQSIDDEQIFSNEIEVIGNIFVNPELLEPVK